jgi:hypothetical protein
MLTIKCRRFEEGAACFAKILPTFTQIRISTAFLIGACSFTTDDSPSLSAPLISNRMTDLKDQRPGGQWAFRQTVEGGGDPADTSGGRQRLAGVC